MFLLMLFLVDHTMLQLITPEECKPLITINTEEPNGIHGWVQTTSVEDKYDEMVQLDNKSRLRMGKAAIKYFMLLYDIVKCSIESERIGD